MKIIIETGASIDPKDKFGDTPLHKCVVNGHSNCIQGKIKKKKKYLYFIDKISLKKIKINYIFNNIK